MNTERKAHSLIDKVYSLNNLCRAWKKVRANKGAAGVDRVSITDFETQVDKHLLRLQRQLMQNRYTPKPVKRVYIPKANNPTELRPLGIPTVYDRVCQQAVLQVLAPLSERIFSDRSYGYRPGRSARQAMVTLQNDVQDGYRHTVDADIKSFFDKLDHKVIMSRMAARVADGRVLNLIEAFLGAAIQEADGSIRIPTEGSPQGGVISPLLANIVLHDLDQAISRGGWRHVRYADDFVVLTKTHQEARRALAQVQQTLAELKLTLHDEKTKLTTVSKDFTFLGFRIHRSRIGIKAQAVKRFRDKVRHVTRRNQGCNVDAVIQHLNPLIRGWGRYYGSAEVWKLYRELDCWIRMRVRSFRTKRRSMTDNGKISSDKLERWGLLSLRDLRPPARFSLRRTQATRAA